MVAVECSADQNRLLLLAGLRFLDLVTIEDGRVYRQVPIVDCIEEMRECLGVVLDDIKVTLRHSGLREYRFNSEALGLGQDSHEILPKVKFSVFARERNVRALKAWLEDIGEPTLAKEVRELFPEIFRIHRRPLPPERTLRA